VLLTPAEELAAFNPAIKFKHYSLTDLLQVIFFTIVVLR